MRRMVLVGCLLASLASIAATNSFTSSKTRQANSNYVADLKKAKDRYLFALKEAQDAAFQAKDREEVNRIQSEMDKMKSLAGAERKAPYAGKSFQSPKYGEITFREDGIYLSSDQKPETARWYSIDDGHALVWTEGGWATLFVFDKEGTATSAYNVGHVDDRPAWVAPVAAGRK